MGTKINVKIGPKKKGLTSISVKVAVTQKSVVKLISQLLNCLEIQPNQVTNRPILGLEIDFKLCCEP